MNTIGRCTTGSFLRRFAMLGLVAAFVCLLPGKASGQTEEETATEEDEEGVVDWLMDRYDPNPFDAYGFEYPYIGDAPRERSLNLPHDWAWKSDHQLKADVRNQLTSSPFVDEDDIEVSVDQGVVTLKGTVEDQEELREAVLNAQEAGAKEVISRLQTRTDD